MYFISVISPTSSRFYVVEFGQHNDRVFGALEGAGSQAVWLLFGPSTLQGAGGRGSRGTNSLCL